MRAIDADALINEIKKDVEKAIEQDDRFGYFWLVYIAVLVIKQPTIQPEERTEERTETHSCDLISRQAAIDALARIAREKFNLSDEYGQYLAGLMDAQVEIEKLPSVQPEQKWSLCSERMPEEREWIGTKRFGTTISDEVYVTFESPKGERFCKHLSFQNGKLSAFDKSTIDAFYKGSKAIAWMPLPKPYREGGTT